METEEPTMTREQLAAMVERENIVATTMAQAMAIAIRKTARGPNGDIHGAMTIQCEAFHVLEGVPGTRPWDPEALYEWAFGPAPTPATLQCVRFVLTLWNASGFLQLEQGTADGGAHEPLGLFNVFDALGSWDAKNRSAFVAWASDPWWP